ncbi:MAG: hypothetical protein ACREX8_16925, partial [Gammaproteobacteria bacterium]
KDADRHLRSAEARVAAEIAYRHKLPAKVRVRNAGSLFVRPEEKDHDLFLHVTYRKRSETFKVHGLLSGFLAKQRGTRRHRPTDAYVVTVKQQLPPETLIAFFGWKAA